MCPRQLTLTAALFTVNKYWVSQGSPNSDFWGHEVSLKRRNKRKVQGVDATFVVF